MLFPTTDLQLEIKKSLSKKAARLSGEGKLGNLVSIIVGDSPEQESYVKIKSKIGSEIGIAVQKLSLPGNISQLELIALVRDLSKDTNTAGIIIQQPLPRRINPTAVYESMSVGLDIEGHKAGSPFVFPLVQACLIGLLYAQKHELAAGGKVDMGEIETPISISDDLLSWLQTKKIAIAGNGLTTGRQIAKYLKQKELSFDQTNSKSRYPDGIYKKSDIIICGVGKEVITENNIRPGVVLLNFGLRNTQVLIGGVPKKRLKGDYDENKIKEVASLYTKTPGGLGPIDVLCLMGNLLEAADKFPKNR